MNYKFLSFEIPEHMVASILKYVEFGIRPGSFLQAIICNNLKEAVGQADNENLKNLPAFVNYFYNKTPSICWGSLEKMILWEEHGGANGLTKKGGEKINEVKNG